MHLRVALGQINVTVGDLEGNATKVIDVIESSASKGADLVVLPELVLTGYPPEDLVLKPGFVADNRAALERVAVRTTGCTAVVGFVDSEGPRRFDAAAVCRDGRIVEVVRKRLLPNYAVFDERRYFDPGVGATTFDVSGSPVGVAICEDLWEPGPAGDLAAAGASLIVAPNASPYFRGRIGERQRILAARVAEARRPIVYVNLVGGQDELVFDGGSMVLDAHGDVVARLPQFREEVTLVDLDMSTRGLADPAPLAPERSPLDEVWAALQLGTADYVRKNGFTDVVLGLSGGIDSAMVAVVAADAVGADHVHTVAMPSRHSSQHSLDDAAELARRLGLDHRVIDIEPAHVTLTETLAPTFGDRPPGVTEENLQSRIRGTVLKSIENKLGWLLLSTGNKSEMAVGFATLYGDMNGGFNPVKDVPKTLVYDLVRWRNQLAVDAGAEAPVPEQILTKAPSAELRPDQRDDQSLPPYEVLDPILEAYIEHDHTAADLVAAGHDPELVHRIVRLIEIAEYKRRQAPPGVRITPKAFGKDRRMPITNRYRG